MNVLGLRRDCLPQVRPPGSVIGPLLPALAGRWGLRVDTQVVAGTTDGVAAFLATGAAQYGDAVTSLGSTLVIKLLSDRAVSAPDYGVYSHRLADRPDGHQRWLVGGASNSGGAALLRHFSVEQMAALTPLLQPERPTGLDYYPLPGRGERFPVNDPHLSSRDTPRPVDDVLFFQGLLEGIAAIEAQAYHRIAELGARPLTSVRSVGGGAGNRAWTTIRQQTLGVPMLVPAQDEAACGAAVLAWSGWRTFEAEFLQAR
jgi:sugar (pentulose or hexulose) kinase